MGNRASRTIRTKSAKIHVEPPRDSQRLQFLRGWSHEKSNSLAPMNTALRTVSQRKALRSARSPLERRIQVVKALLLSLICILSLSMYRAIHAKADKSDALFVVIVNDKRGYIDANGRIAIKPQFEGANPFSEGLAVVAMSENGYAEGYIDSTGAKII